MPFDIVIVGGGLSGLALAAELAGEGVARVRILVLEQRKTYVRDRTWSYWKTSKSPAHRYSHLERHQWTQWHVQEGQRIHHHGNPISDADNSAEKYCTVDGDAFYAAAQRLVASTHHVELRLGVSVQRISDAPDPSVTLESGEVIRAQWVFDARPLPGSSSGLVQQFLGHEIKVDRDVFDASTVNLMHFVPSPLGLHFFYVLPYSPRDALIETTWISSPLLKPDFEQELRQFIKTLVGSAAYEVAYEEKGSLCLDRDVLLQNNSSRVATLGRRAGTLRASTGYAFLETLAHTKEIATSLTTILATDKLTNWQVPAFKRSKLDLWMDSIFLNELARDWGNSYKYFMQLFARVDSSTLVAFLSGTANLRQRLRVATALPTLPFAKQALATWQRPLQEPPMKHQ